MLTLSLTILSTHSISLPLILIHMATLPSIHSISLTIYSFNSLAQMPHFYFLPIFWKSFASLKKSTLVPSSLERLKSQTQHYWRIQNTIEPPKFLYFVFFSNVGFDWKKTKMWHLRLRMKWLHCQRSATNGPWMEE